MCNNTDNDSCKCIAEILTVINILQQNACCSSESCLETCDRGFLGCGVSTLSGNGTPWSMPTTRENVNCSSVGATCSSVFRVEKIDGCCATFRVLAANPDAEETNIPYVATNSFFTMNLNCVCCLKCLPDTVVECI